MVTPSMPGPDQWGPGPAPVHAPQAHAQAGAPPPAAPTFADRWERLKPRVRLIGAAAIALLAVLTLALFAPQPPSTNASAERLAIWIDDSANQDRTEGAPQQAVVNGWTTTQLLDVISSQLDEPQPVDQRPAVLLTLGVLLLALTTVTGTHLPSRRASSP